MVQFSLAQFLVFPVVFPCSVLSEVTFTTIVLPTLSFCRDLSFLRCICLKLWIPSKCFTPNNPLWFVYFHFVTRQVLFPSNSNTWVLFASFRPPFLWQSSLQIFFYFLSSCIFPLFFQFFLFPLFSAFIIHSSSSLSPALLLPPTPQYFCVSLADFRTYFHSQKMSQNFPVMFPQRYQLGK